MKILIISVLCFEYCCGWWKTLESMIQQHLWWRELYCISKYTNMFLLGSLQKVEISNEVAFPVPGWWRLDSHDLGHRVQTCWPSKTLALQRGWYQHPRQGMCAVFCIWKPTFNVAKLQLNLPFYSIFVVCFVIFSVLLYI